MRLAAAVLLAFAAAHAEMPVRYVLAERVLLADPAPDPRFDAQSIARGEFRSRFEAAFPGQVLELSPDRMVSPDERVIVVLPRVLAVRTAHMVQAGPSVRLLPFSDGSAKSRPRQTFTTQTPR